MWGLFYMVITLLVAYTVKYAMLTPEGTDKQGSLTWGSTHENDTLYLFNSFHALVKLV